MPSLPAIGFKGLKTSGNELSWPAGSLLQAANCAIPSKDVLANRRGQPLDYAHTFGSTNDIARAATEYQGKVVAHYGADTAYGTALAMATPKTGSWSALTGSWAAPDETSLRMKFAELAKNLYWTSSTGLGVLDGVASGTARAAGVGRPGDFYSVTTRVTGNPNTGWMPKDCAVGYRAVVGRKDANDNVKLSAPCGRFVVINPADVTVAVGNLARTGGTTVTATVTSHGFQVGDVFALSPGEANFAAGNYTVTGITSTTIVYASAGANVVSTAQQTLSSGSKDVALRVVLPEDLGIVAGDFVQVYRTLISASAATDPGDEEFLAYERTITSTDITNRYTAVTDSTPESFIGAALYCNANTGKGAAFTNVTPPLCDDVCVFDGRLWGTNTQSVHQLTIRCIGIGSPNGLQSGDFIAVAEKAYPVTVVNQYGATRNVRETNANWAFARNISTDDPFVAMSVPNTSIDTTELLLQRRMLTQDVFYVASSRTTCWQEAMPTLTPVDEATTSRLDDVVTVTTTASHGLATGQSVMLAIQDGGSPAEANFPTGVKGPITVTGATTFTYDEAGADATMTGTPPYFVYATTLASKRYEKQLRFGEPGQPEAWPLVNFVSGLPDGLEVSRIAALRGSLYVCFRRGPIYTVSGSYPYTVSLFDDTATLLAPDSLAKHDGRLWGLTTQGVVAISEGGVQPMSLDIEDTLNEAALSATAMASTFAVSYEGDRQYILCLGNSDPGAIPYWSSDAYVYRSDVGQWVGPWRANPFGWTCGLVLKSAAASAELLCFGTIAENCLRYESKTYGHLDDYDDIVGVGDGTDIDNTAEGVLEATYGTVAGFDTIEVGDLILVTGESDSAGGHVTGVEVVETPGPIYTTVVTTDGDFNPGGTVAITVYKPIGPLAVEWLAVAAGAPAIEKQFAEAMVHCDAFEVDRLQAVYTTERTQDTQESARTLTVDAAQLGKWRFGTIDRNLFNLRLGVSQETQRAAMLRVRLAFQEATESSAWAGQHFRLLGYSLSAEGSSVRTGYKSGVAP